MISVLFLLVLVKVVDEEVVVRREFVIRWVLEDEGGDGSYDRDYLFFIMKRGDMLFI